MDLRDVHYDYVVNVMGQDPEVIKELIYLIDEIPDDLNNVFSKKIFFISSLQANIVNKLFEKYVEINSKLEEEDKKK